jgi:two-component system, sensor histidine kinase and response regulator
MSGRNERIGESKMQQAFGDEFTLPDNPAPILLVEDNPVNQKVALILIERLGLSAQLASNGIEAVELVAQQTFSLILMDCHMPEMDGFEATVAIRKLEEESDRYTPIIAVTALAMAGDRERCIAAGMDDYITKPIDKELLKAKLNHWLRTDAVFRSQIGVRKHARSHANLMVVENNPIDLEELEQFYGTEQLSQMLNLFVANTEDMLKRIKQFNKERNARGVAGLAHELKASCAALGTKQLARLSLFLEQAVGQQDWIEAEETIASLQRSFDHLKSCAEYVLTPEDTSNQPSGD